MPITKEKIAETVALFRGVEPLSETQKDAVELAYKYLARLSVGVTARDLALIAAILEAVERPSVKAPPAPQAPGKK